MTDAEIAKLRDYLTMLRLRGWLPDWISGRFGVIATAGLPQEKSPTPLQIMGSVTNEIADFQSLIENAKHLAKMRPDLFHLAQGHGTRRRRD